MATMTPCTDDIRCDCRDRERVRAVMVERHECLMCGEEMGERRARFSTLFCSNACYIKAKWLRGGTELGIVSSVKATP